MSNTFVKTFLISIAIVATLIYTTCYWSWLIYPERFPLVQYDEEIILPTELPDTGVEVWNWDCSSYWTNSYWKEWTCFTSKWARTFSKTITNTTDTKHVCTLDDNQLSKLMNRLQQLELEYSKMDVMCMDIIKVENQIKDLVSELFVWRDKTITNSNTVETAKWIPFPAPTVKYITKTVTVKICWVWIYDKQLDACIMPITGAR